MRRAFFACELVSAPQHWPAGLPLAGCGPLPSVAHQRASGDWIRVANWTSGVANRQITCSTCAYCGMRTLLAPTASVPLAVRRRYRPPKGSETLMPTGGPEDPWQHLFREVERDFEALVRLIERAIEHLVVNGTGNGSVLRLTRAKEAAELGAALARRGASPSPQADD